MKLDKFTKVYQKIISEQRRTDSKNDGKGADAYPTLKKTLQKLGFKYTHFDPEADYDPCDTFVKHYGKDLLCRIQYIYEEHVWEADACFEPEHEWASGEPEFDPNDAILSFINTDEFENLYDYVNEADLEAFKSSVNQMKNELKSVLTVEN